MFSWQSAKTLGLYGTAKQETPDTTAMQVQCVYQSNTITTEGTLLNNYLNKIT